MINIDLGLMLVGNSEIPKSTPAESGISLFVSSKYSQIEIKANSLIVPSSLKVIDTSLFYTNMIYETVTCNLDLGNVEHIKKLGPFTIKGVNSSRLVIPSTVNKIDNDALIVDVKTLDFEENTNITEISHNMFHASCIEILDLSRLSKLEKFDILCSVNLFRLRELYLPKSIKHINQIFNIEKEASDSEDERKKFMSNMLNVVYAIRKKCVTFNFMHMHTSKELYKELDELANKPRKALRKILSKQQFIWIYEDCTMVANLTNVIDKLLKVVRQSCCY